MRRGLAGAPANWYEQIAAEIPAEADAVDAAEDLQFGEARGDELPAERADPSSRKARLREAKRRMDASMTPPSRPTPSGSPHVTDLDSRSVCTARGFIQGYNTQAVTTSGQIIIAAEVEIGGTDQGATGTDDPLRDRSASGRGQPCADRRGAR